MAKPDPHEVMTAALILRGEAVNVQQLNRDPIKNATVLVQDLVDRWVNKIVGGSGDAGFFTEAGGTKVPNMVNLAKALSVSNYVVDQIDDVGAKIETVWQTGKQWAGEIRKFNPDVPTIKNYNSSDIILKVQTGGKTEAIHYWGLSLKKRGVKEADPTLLNKPVLGDVGFMTKRFSGAEVTKIQKAKEKFFLGALNIASGGEYEGKDIKKMSHKEVLASLDKIFKRDRTGKRNMLTGQGVYDGNKNIYFEEMHKAFMKFDNDKKFFEEFFDLIFKINLDTYIQDAVFHFSLMTGVGDYKDNRLIVEPPVEKEGRLTSEIFRKMFKDPDTTNFTLQMATPRNKKVHAWEDGKKTAAKLFYEMVIGKSPAVSIVDLEVRYKGDLKPQPQFQVFINKVRKNSFHHEYKKVAKTEALGRTKWF